MKITNLAILILILFPTLSTFIYISEKHIKVSHENV